MFAIVLCLSACVRRASREALNQAHNVSIHWWLCVTQHLQLLIPHVGLPIQALLVQNLLLMNLLIIVVEMEKGKRWETPQEISLNSGAGGKRHRKASFKSGKQRRDQAGVNLLNFFTTSLQTNRKKEK